MRVRLRWLMGLIAILAALFGAIAWGMKSETFSRFCGIGADAIQLGSYIYPWFLWGAGAGMVVAFLAVVADRRTWRVRSLWFLLPFVIPVVILWFGIAFRQQGAPDARTHLRVLVLQLLFWSHVPIAIGLLACFRSRSSWSIIIGLSIAATWLSLGALVMSAMAVTNVWL